MFAYILIAFLTLALIYTTFRLHLAARSMNKLLATFEVVKAEVRGDE